MSRITDTRALYYDKLTKTITVYIPKKIIKNYIPLDFEIRTITVYVQKNIIKYSSSYNITSCFSVYANDSKDLKNTITLYNYNLSKDILIYDQKDIINFITTFDQKPKVILDLCNAINPNLNRFYNMDANADKNNNINTKYLNIFLLCGVAFSLCAPILIYTLTGLNLYDQDSINESIYSKSFTNIRLTCAIIFLYSIVYLWFSNVDKLKLSIFNKHILWAPVLGALDKMNNPELNEEPVSTNEEPVSTNEENVITTNKWMLNKNKWPELNENEISKSSKFADEDNDNFNSKSFSEPRGIPIPNYPGYFYIRPNLGWDKVSSSEEDQVVQLSNIKLDKDINIEERKIEGDKSRGNEFDNKKKKFFIESSSESPTSIEK